MFLTCVPDSWSGTGVGEYRGLLAYLGRDRRDVGTNPVFAIVMARNPGLTGG